MFAAATAADAQTCSLALNAPPSACTSVPVSASVQPPAGGGSWASVSWTISGGQFHVGGGFATTATGESVTFSPTGTGPVTLTTNATDAAGCTTPDVVTTLPVTDSPVLVIAAPSQSCAYAPSVASVTPPGAGSWTNVYWSISGGEFIVNGSPTTSATGETVEFRTFSPGPAYLHASAQHSSGCPVSEATATVATRSIPAPVITVPSQICPYSPGTASVAPPAEGTWVEVFWSISGGNFRDANGNYVNSLMNAGEPVTFEVSSPGPATITANARDSFGCWTAEQGTATVANRTIPAPVITAPAQVCPYSPATATLAPPAEGTWSQVYWSISGGNFRDATGNYVTSLMNTGEPVTFEVSSPGPATITASAQDSFGCWSYEQASATVANRTIPAPVITAPAQACPYTPATATIAPPAEGTWTRVYWSISGGNFRDGNGTYVNSLMNTGEPVTFEVSSPGPATITANAQDSFGCWSYEQASATVANRTIPAPVITAPAQACPYTPATATIAPPAEGTWSRVSWSISGGNFRDEFGNYSSYIMNTGEPVTFEVSSPGPATITASAQDSFGCWTYEQASATVANRAIPAPIITAPAEACPYTPATATIAPPAEGTWTRVSWSISGGSFRDEFGNSVTYLMNTGEPVTFEVSSPGPATITAGAQDSFGCWTYEQASATVAARVIPNAVINAPAQACPGAPATASVAAPAEGTWVRVYWSISGGYFRDEYGNQVTSLTNMGEPVTFEVTSPGPATLSAGGQHSSGCWTPDMASVTVAARVIPNAVINAPAEVCPGTPASASVAPPAEGSWVRVHWSISGGYLRDEYGNQVTSLTNMGEPVTFEVTSPGPATLSAGGQDSSGCWTPDMASVTVAAASIAAPVITAPASICPGVPGTASIAAPAQGTWTAVHWSITGGYFLDQNGNQVASLTNSGEPVTFELSAPGPATISATAQSSSGCWAPPAEATVTAGEYPPVAIVLDNDTVCLNSTRSASIEGSWQSVNWSITGGTITSSPGNAVVTFTVNEPTVTLSVSAVSPNGCVMNNARTVTVTTMQAPEVSVSVPTLCIYTTATATVTNNPPYPVEWSITGGQIIGSTSGTSISFFADGTDPVTLTAYTASGCGTSTSVTVPVHPTTQPSITASHAMPFCPGTPVTLTASEGVSWRWSTGETTQSIVITVGGFYRVSITDANGCVRDWTFNAQQQVMDTPTIVAYEPTRFCEGGSVELIASPSGGNYTFLWSNGATTPRITVTQAGNYTVTITNPSGCSRTSEAVTVTVDPAPQAVITAPANSVCNSNTGLRLDATPGADAYLWSTGEETPSIVVWQPGDYTVTVTKNGCSKTSAPFSVVPPVYPPMPAVTDVWALSCPNGTASASITNADQYARLEWTIEDGVILGANDQASVTFRNNTANTRLRIRGYSATGCFYDNYVYVLADPPTSDFMAPTRACAGSYASAGIYNGGSNATTYSWTVENATIMALRENNTQVFFIPNGNGPVTITSTADRNGCIRTTTKVIEVDSLAEPVITGPAPKVCTVSGHTATVSDAGEGATYSWTIYGGTFTSPSTGRTVTFDVDPDTNTLLRVTVTKGGCTKYETIETDYDVPQAAITASATTLCPNATATLTSTPAASYLWSNGATSQSIAVSEPGTYTVTTTSTGGCSTTSAPVTITAETASRPMITLTPPQVCWQQQEVTATLTNAGDYTSFQWATNGFRLSETGNTLTIRRAQGTDVYWIDVIGTTAAGCQLTTRVEIPVTPVPDTTITSSAESFCAGGSYTLSVPDAGPGARYQWRLSAGENISGSTTRTLTFTPVYNTYPVYIYCDITEAQGCSVTAEKVIPVNPQPNADITAASQVCVGRVSTASVPGYDVATYAWTVTGGVLLSGQGTREITYRGDAPGTIQLTATITRNGCSATDTHTVTVDQYSSTITASGPTEFCRNGSVTLTAMDGGPGATYLWNTGATSQSILVITGGVYNVTVRYSNGCTAPSNDVAVTVNEPPPTPEITAGGPLTFCEGGSVTLTAPEGYTYLWSTGATTPSIAASETNSYSVTVYDGNGCGTTSYPVSVWVHDAPGTINTWTYGPTTFCEGGSVTIVASSEFGHNFRWSNGATSQAITVTESGSYTVTVTNDNGCSNTSAPVNVTVLPAQPKPTITLSGPTEFCEGGSLTLTAPEAYSYAWSNGETTRSITVQYGGNYSVTVSNAEGCGATSDPVYVRVFGRPYFNWTYYGEVCAGVESSRQISLPPDAVSTAWSITNGTITRTENDQVWFIATANPVTLTATVTGNTGCTYTSSQTLTVNSAVTPTITAGGATSFCSGGSVTLTSSPASSYLWSNGATSQSITVSASGSYTVTTTDAKGCSATSAPTAVTVNDNPAATISTSGSTTFCAGGSVTLTASAGASYLWSNGSTDSSITVSEPGSYTVTVTSGSGCSTTSAPTVVTVHANPAATIAASGDTAFCSGNSVTLTASTGTSYLWSTGATSPSITVSESGSYTVTVTNENGCSTTSAPTAVTVHDNPAATITASGDTAFCTGNSVTLTASAGTSYLWSTGATSPSITVSESGSYTVTVTNEKGCSTTSAPTVVTVHDNPAATISASGDTAFCSGNSVTLTASAGTSYLWSTGETSPSITVDESGSYTVTVTNANGCSTTSAPKVVTVHADPTATISASGDTTFCEGGSVVLTASAGTSYLWSTGETSPSITVDESGSYTVTVTNANGCSATSAPTVVTVHAAPAATITASGDTAFCSGNSVTLTASAGTSYLWSTGEISPSITVDESGSYTVTVTNANGCSTTSAPTAVTVHADPTATISASGDTAFCAGGSVVLTASPGSSYLWSTGATSPSITVSESGSYTVTVTNANGCSATSAPTVVTVHADPTATISAGGDTAFCSGNSVVLTASPGTSYLWSTGETSPSITVDESGSYTVTVTNANGCSATSAPTVVTVHADPTATISASGDTSFCSGNSVVLTASAGTSYLWSTGETSPSITVDESGSYTVTVTNANGCSATSAPTVVTVHADPTATISADGDTTFCEGSSVVLTASPGSSYLWSNGSIEPSITVTESGSYTVTVTNANGCSATSAPTVVTVNAKPAASISASGNTTFCAGGSVVLTASPGSSYLWSNGSIEPSITVTQSGSYTVTVTNANGCSTVSAPTSVTVNPLPEVPVISANGPLALCPGANVVLTAPGGYTYLWSNGSRDQSITVNTAGEYSVTVTNANGCSRTSAAVTVSNNPATAITVQPSNITLARNQPGSLSVTATGTATLRYQWYEGSTGDTSRPITTNGGTTRTLTVTQSRKGTYRYWVRVSSSTCTGSVANSVTATVTVN